MNPNQQLAIQALEQMRGDDLYRARFAFRLCTEKEMDEQWGQSGKTRRELVTEYEQHEAKIESAIYWLKSL